MFLPLIRRGSHPRMAARDAGARVAADQNWPAPTTWVPPWRRMTVPRLPRHTIQLCTHWLGGGRRAELDEQLERRGDAVGIAGGEQVEQQPAGDRHAQPRGGRCGPGVGSALDYGGGERLPGRRRHPLPPVGPVERIRPA